MILEEVALRKESVDRNESADNSFGRRYASLSARRAWIEIRLLSFSVLGLSWSLSARRAWIEINMLCSVAKL